MWTTPPNEMPPSSNSDEFVDQNKSGQPGVNARKPTLNGTRASLQITDDTELSSADWLLRAKTAYQQSNTFFDSNWRPTLNDNISMFNGEFPAGSKFNHPGATRMSRLFRPKSRSTVRKQEAAAAVAFFSNVDQVDITPMNEDSKPSAAAASLMKQIVNYRLTVSIPWYQILIGAFQDAMVQGLCIAEAYWDYEKRDGKIIKDKPAFELIPLEQIRFDPYSDWTDPIESSPYIIHLKPMFVGDVKEKMRSKEWLTVSDSTLRLAASMIPNSTDQARAARKDFQNTQISEYEVVWVQRHIHKHAGEDWEFYTLGEVAMLSTPTLLSESVAHGKRPYVCGTTVIQSHDVVPTSLIGMGKDLQEEANTVVNQRLDNVKFVLNKRYIVNRGKNVDVASLVRNVPGGVTLADSFEDIKELSWPDVTSSAFAEQDRINSDMDELQGNFSAGSIMTNRKLNETVGGMKLLAGNSNVMVEYNLRTFAQTFVEPLLRQLVLLEQQYESDDRIMVLAAQKAKLFTRFGMNGATDKMLREEMLLRVNVGMGATDPTTKVQNLMQGISTIVSLAEKAPQLPGIDLDEISKEVFGSLGFADGTRFFNAEAQKQANPEMQQAQQMIQQLQQQLTDKNNELAAKLQIAELQAQNKILVQHMTNIGWLARADVAAKNTPSGSMTQDDIVKTMGVADTEAMKLAAPQGPAAQDQAAPAPDQTPAAPAA